MCLRFALVLLLCAGFAAPAFTQGSSTWFLAEGASNATFDEDILIGNPSPGTVTAVVKLLPAPDALVAPGTVLEKAFAVPGTGRLTVNIRREFPGLVGATSAQVTGTQGGAPVDIVVERSMFFPLAPTPYAGGTGASGVTTPATRWILAEGASGAFDTFILIVNPGTTVANVTVRYLPGNGPVVTTTRSIAPGTRATLWPTQENPTVAEFSTVVESDVPVVAERAMYFDNYRSGHDAVGIAVAPGSNGRLSWFFAEGFTGGNAQIAFETFLLIGNDNDQDATVTATYFLEAGSPPIARDYIVKAHSRFNIWTDAEVDAGGNRLLPNMAFSVRLDSTVPVVAARAMYWGTPSATDPTQPVLPWKEGHVVGGIPGPEPRWAFAEGRQGPDLSGATFDSFFLVVNPNAGPIDVRAVFATEDGTGLTTTVRVPGNTRYNIWPTPDLTNPDGTRPFALLHGRRFAVFLEAVGGEPFVAERAMYWNDYLGGHANAGTPWAGAIALPAQAPADVHITGMSPSSGRLAGGTIVTITGGGFGGTATEVYFGGQRITPAAVGPSSITFTVPVRTAETGFGTAGPAAVGVLSRGRFVRAPNFTRYFSVLAFGDSLTWGTRTDTSRAGRCRRRSAGPTRGRCGTCSRAIRSSARTRS